MTMNISYQDFAARFEPYLWSALNQAERGRALTLAWEECAWIAPLTDERGKLTLEDVKDAEKALRKLERRDKS